MRHHKYCYDITDNLSGSAKCAEDSEAVLYLPLESVFDQHEHVCISACSRGHGHVLFVLLLH